MKPLEMLLKNAARSQKKIVLSEGSDPRVVRAAIAARAQAGLITVFVSHDRDLLATAPRLLYIAPGVAKLGPTQDVFAYLAERQRQAAEAIAASPTPNRGTAA
jgi:phosphotransacetylase